VPAVELEGFEADDLIASHARQAAAGAEVTIAASDKDERQRVGGRIAMLDSLKSRTIGSAEMMEKFGVGSDTVIEVQALAGNSSDNPPYVPGIGDEGILSALVRGRRAPGPFRAD